MKVRKGKGEGRRLMEGKRRRKVDGGKEKEEKRKMDGK